MDLIERIKRWMVSEREVADHGDRAHISSCQWLATVKQMW